MAGYERCCGCPEGREISVVLTLEIETTEIISDWLVLAGNREFDRTPWSKIHAPMPAVWKNDMHESASVEAEGNIYCIAEITEGFSNSITIWKLIHEDYSDKTEAAWHTSTVMPVSPSRPVP